MQFLAFVFCLPYVKFELKSIIYSEPEENTYYILWRKPDKKMYYPIILEDEILY